MGHERRAQLRASVVIGIGVLLAVAATIGPLLPPSAEPGGSLSVRLPDAARMAVLALFAASALLLLGMQRPRRPAEDEPQLERAPQRRSPWAALLALLPFFVLIAVAWYLMAHRSEDGSNPIDRAITAIAGLMDLLAAARKPATSVPFFDVTITVLVVLVALAFFALMVIVAMSDRLEKWFARDDATDAPPAPPDEPDAPLGDPRAEPDPRLAILRAWDRFEHAVAAAHAPRAPWQTPAELMRSTIARLPVPAPPVQQLTALFEVARFSDRPVSADAREAACDCLDEITKALTSVSEGVPTVSEGVPALKRGWAVSEGRGSVAP